MRRTEIEFLYDYDRWATGQILDASLGLSADEWAAESVIGDRGIGGILVHALGAHERWRIGFEGGRRPATMREEEPLPAPDELREAWQAEWALLREFVAGLDEARLDVLHGEAPLWQGLVQLINHGTQHRSEAAVILTAAGCSPGDLDIVRFNFERLHGVLD
ncbi:MAG TPA: DinB family protein [Candidatus Limnocylindrales bacterium]|nr:DinB family protein [Candidatus Limnocylindrales bacterium]